MRSLPTVTFASGTIPGARISLVDLSISTYLLRVLKMLYSKGWSRYLPLVQRGESISMLEVGRMSISEDWTAFVEAHRSRNERNAIARDGYVSGRLATSCKGNRADPASVIQ